jgi:hypothetical protein
MINRRNRGYLWAGIIVSGWLFYIFKQFYPYPNMVMDSYVYLNAAVNDLGANSFPIGYSKFLQFFIFLGCSADWVVWVQFLILDLALLHFFVTIFHFFQPSRTIAIFLWIFLFCNPLLYYLSNFIMSDTLFTALSLFWVTQLIWIIASPKRYMIWTHAALLILAFSVRYNALYYPVVSLLALLVSRYRIREKVLAIGLPLLLLGCFIGFTREEMKKLTGVSQFSPFGGWQLANNALYVYEHTYQGATAVFEGDLGQLDLIVRRYFDRAHRAESLLDYNANESGFYYSADGGSPLMSYMVKRYGPDTAFQDFRKWGPMGELCSRYGSRLIKLYPLAFIRYWAGPNTIRYFYPPSEIFAKYSPYFLREDDFGRMAQQALGVRTLTVGMGLIRFRTKLLSFYPTLILLLNIWFILAVSGFWLVGGGKRIDKPLLPIIRVIACLWLCNFLFSITASCIVLRYQVLIMIVEFGFCPVLTGIIYQIFRQRERVKFLQSVG